MPEATVKYCSRVVQNRCKNDRQVQDLVTCAPFGPVPVPQEKGAKQTEQQYTAEGNFLQERVFSHKKSSIFEAGFEVKPTSNLSSNNQRREERSMLEVPRLVWKRVCSVKERERKDVRRWRLVMERRPGGVCKRGDSEKAAIRKEMVGYALVAQSLMAIMPSGGTPR